MSTCRLKCHCSMAYYECVIMWIKCFNSFAFLQGISFERQRKIEKYLMIISLFQNVSLKLTSTSLSSNKGPFSILIKTMKNGACHHHEPARVQSRNSQNYQHFSCMVNKSSVHEISIRMARIIFLNHLFSFIYMHHLSTL